MTTINIPKTVTSIGEYAFESCSSLSTIDIPNNALNIGKHIFAECNKIKSVYITGGNVVGGSWSDLLDDDGIKDKLNLPDGCKIFKS